MLPVEGEYTLVDTKRLDEMVRLGREAVILGQCVIDRSLEHIKGKRLSNHQWILFGLGLKIYRAFECLVDDAAKSRSEAMHHLKTIIETFIYLKWVAKDSSDLRAKLVYADAVDEKKKYFTKNPDEKFLQEWGKGLVEATKGIETEWKAYREKNIKVIAHEAGMDDWYNRVYAMACEAAHLTDIMAHLPNPDGGFDEYYQPLARYGAFLAVDYGMSVLLPLMQDASGEFELKQEENISGLKARWEVLRTTPDEVTVKQSAHDAF